MQTAKLFANGSSQAVRLPKEFRLPGEEVIVKRQGEMVVLLPTTYSASALQALLDGFEPDLELERPVQAEQQRVFG